MARVELIFDADCPHVETARRLLRSVLAETGEPAQWQEWDRSDPASPAYVRRYGSPTILVDGQDVAGESPAEEITCCRLYRDGQGQVHGVPTADSIMSSLTNGRRGNGSDRGPTAGGFRAWAAVVPAVGVSLLPKLACPACWPAYAGLLSAVGLGFLIDTTYLLPLTVLFLLVAVGALGWRASHRRGFGPFLLGMLAAAGVLVGKFVFNSDPAMYAGIALLVGASLWNSWPRKPVPVESSRACCSENPLHQLESFNQEANHG